MTTIDQWILSFNAANLFPAPGTWAYAIVDYGMWAAVIGYAAHCIASFFCEALDVEGYTPETVLWFPLWVLCKWIVKSIGWIIAAAIWVGLMVAAPIPTAILTVGYFTVDAIKDKKEMTND